MRDAVTGAPSTAAVPPPRTARPAPPRLPRLRGPGGRPLRVLHVTTVDMSLALLLGTELRTVAGTGVEVHAASAPGTYVPAVEATGATFHPLPGFRRSWSLREDLAAGAELARLVRRLRPDVLHVHTPKPGVVGRPLGRALGVPVVVNTCHGLWTRPGQRRWVRGAVMAAEALAGCCSHAELYQNAEDADTLRRWTGRRATVVGNGIDLERFGPDPASRARVRAQWGVPEDRLLVGGVGRVVAEKGVLDLADAAARITADLPAVDVEVAWVGPADDAKADALRSLPPPLVWRGPREDMAAVYAAFDVFVLPSYREGFSRSAMEAAATGLPLVLSDIRGCRELGEDGVDLVLVPPGDPSALADALRRVVTDERLRARLGAAARRRALAHYDQVAVAAASLRAYAQVAARRGLAWEAEGAVT